MSATPGRRRGRGGGSTYVRPKRGIFANGAWLCDCNPRLPALHFQVKKEGPNKGRWFYTCQKQKDDPECCKFYLWDDDAKPREESAVLNNSRTEPGRSVETTTSRPQRSGRISPPPPYKPIDEDSSVSGRKRSRQIVEAEDDEAFGWPPDGSFARDLEGAATAAETPSKAARTSSHTTPSRRTLPWLRDDPPNGIPTPQTEGRFKNDPFPTRLSTPGGSLLTPSRNREDEINRGYRLPSPNTTPTPARFKDVTNGNDSDALVKDIFDVLGDNNILLNEGTRISLKNVLNRYSLRTQGIVKGREMTRLAVKTQEAKNTELQYRINTLEAELEQERALVKHLRWKAETGQESDASIE